MKHISIGGLDVSRIGLGAMSMSGYYNIGEGSDSESIRAIHRALDLGVTHIDTAEIYGPYHNEELVAEPSRVGGTRWCWRRSSVLSHFWWWPRRSRQAAPRISGSRSRAPEAVRHPLYRPVLPTPRRSGDTHRGHSGCPGRHPRPRQGPSHRPVRSRPRHDQARSRGASGGGATDRVLSVEP